MTEQNATVAAAVYDSVPALLAAVGGGRPARREAMTKHVDSLSGSPFEHVTIGRRRFVLKHLGRAIDWIMVALDDGPDGTLPRVALLWRDGVLGRLPAELDHTIEGMAWDAATGLLSVLMRDISATLVPPGDSRVPLAVHRRFLDHMAALHAGFWGFVDTHGLTPPGQLYSALTVAAAGRVAAAGHTDAVPAFIPTGWARLAEADPAGYAVAAALGDDPAPLVAALGRTPSTLVHGDWKFGNLGHHPDGRTVLLDWAWPTASAACVDLAWYLAVNCDRLPESKEDTIAAYRSSLERRGISTVDWWERQLELALLGGFVRLGWSKTHDPAELAWWTARVLPTARDLLG